MDPDVSDGALYLLPQEQEPEDAFQTPSASTTPQQQRTKLFPRDLQRSLTSLLRMLQGLCGSTGEHGSREGGVHSLDRVTHLQPAMDRPLMMFLCPHGESPP
jgi:hypothetical protein